MSDVLLKKIRSATGVPQHVLQMQAFWDGLRSVCSDWSLEAFGVETRPLFDMRRVISGKAALDMLRTGTNFVFPSDHGSGLAVLLLEDDCVLEYAALRLQEDAETLGESSKLFLRLICEDAAQSLRKRISLSFQGDRAASLAASTDDYRAVAGLLAPSSRYLLVSARFPLPSKSVRFSLLFFLDDILKLARRQSNAAADQRAKAYLQTPDSLRKSVKSSVIVMDAVLDRLSMSIGECSRLKEGQILPLNVERIGAVSLTADTISGYQTISRGAIGTFRQNRAVRLTTPVSAAFLANIGEL